jgi:hypothetical protein
MSSTSGSPIENHHHQQEGGPSSSSSSSIQEYDFEGVNGSSNGTANGEIPYGTYKLNFGSNFLSNKNDSQYHILKFDIKPPNVKGNAYINFESNDSMKLTIPTDEPENNATYKGTVCSVKNGKECLLLFDGENLRIEKVATLLTAKHVRCDKKEDDEEMKPNIPDPPIISSTLSSSTITSSIKQQQQQQFQQPQHLQQQSLIKPPSNYADDEEGGAESSSSDDEEEQMLLEQIASSTQPPSNPEQQIFSKPHQQLPIYTPSSLPSPARTTSSSSAFHPSPAISIPTPPSKNSSLLEDLMMSDSSADSSDSSDSDSEDDQRTKSSSSMNSKVLTSNSKSVRTEESMDYTLNNSATMTKMDYSMNNEKNNLPSFDSFIDKSSTAVTKNNEDIRNLITGGGFNLLSSDLQLSEDSSDED